ncbi:MAG TPA: ABC transporter permease [Ktedonobacterales bacterium]
MAQFESSALSAPDTPSASTSRLGVQYPPGGASAASRVLASRRAGRPRRFSRRMVTLLSPVALGLIGLLVWQFLVQGGAISSYLLPTPAQVAHAFVSALQSGLFAHYGATTLIESLLGFALGAIVALPLGYAIAMSRVLAAALEPYLAASQAIPAVALAPLLALWLPYGTPPVVALCALIVFFPAAVNTTLGFRTLDHEVVDAARLDGAGAWSLLRHIETPLALPTILAGLRTSLTLSITGAVVGEFVMGDQGLGGLLTIARGNFDAPLVFATLFALALLATALYGVARFIEWFLDYLEA